MRFDDLLFSGLIYVAAIGNVNEATNVEYIRNQEESDKLEDQGESYLDGGN